MLVEIVERRPTVAEFAAITAAVGFKPHMEEAILLGLANSFSSVSAARAGHAPLAQRPRILTKKWRWSVGESGLAAAGTLDRR
jgi:hypothetical protein